MNNTMNELVKTIQEAVGRQAEQAKPTAYDTPATVRRIENGTAWVHIPGGVDETPVKLTIAANVGDEVQVRVSGGRAFLVGNGSAPPTDDTTAIYARTIATTAQTTAEAAQEVAESVEGIAATANSNASAAITLAEGIDDHFWSDSAGAHITEDDQETYLQDPSAAGGNTLITSAGMAVRHGTTQLAAFTSTGAQIGQNASGQSRSVISTNGMQIVQNVGGVDTQIANLGYGNINYHGGSQSAPYYSFGSRITTGVDPIGIYSVAENEETKASGKSSHAEGYQSSAIGDVSHVEGYQSEANNANVPISGGWYEVSANHAEGYSTTSSGQGSHAEGMSSTASNEAAHAEGKNATASGSASHAEGSGTTATKEGAHAEGAATRATGDQSHAEGFNCIASAAYSHAQNYYTKAGSSYQTAIGKYNVEDTNGDYAAIIGNGTSNSSRSNALTVDWSGNVEAAGGATLGDDLSVTGDITASSITVGGHSTAIGTTYSAAWTAASSASTSTNLTDEITLPPGTYIIVVSTPTTNRTQSYMLTNISSTYNKYWQAVSAGTFTVILTLTSTTTTRVRPASSTSTTYSNTERGHLEAVRIA